MRAEQHADTIQLHAMLKRISFIFAHQTIIITKQNIMLDMYTHTYN